jgi:zinc and cadmium transporter
MSVFFQILLSTVFISLLSFAGAVLLFFNDSILKKLSIYLVAFAGGAFLGGAFLHILPEAIELGVSDNMYIYVLVGFVLVFLLEVTLHWHHTHEETQEHAPFGTLTLVADGFHNFIDGVILAALFLVDVKLGLVGTVATAFHEIPQEISEFGVLLHAGYKKHRALLFNFLSAATVIVGGAVGYLFGGLFADMLPGFLLFAVGSFMYLGAAAFVPEIRKREGSFLVLLTFACGILFMWLLTFFE